MKEAWTTSPPTDEDIKNSYNGFFWIRYKIIDDDIDEDGVWPSLYKIEPTQVMYLYEATEEINLATKANNRVITLNEITLHLADHEEMDGIEWHPMIPPTVISKSDI